VLPSSRSSWDVLGALIVPSKERVELCHKSGKKIAKLKIMSLQLIQFRIDKSCTRFIVFIYFAAVSVQLNFRNTVIASFTISVLKELINPFLRKFVLTVNKNDSIFDTSSKCN
jgi:dolichol kinase